MDRAYESQPGIRRRQVSCSLNVLAYKRHKPAVKIIWLPFNYFYEEYHVLKILLRKFIS